MQARASHDWEVDERGKGKEFEFFDVDFDVDVFASFFFFVFFFFAAARVSPPPRILGSPTIVHVEGISRVQLFLSSR